MLPPPITREWARRLIACEAGTSAWPATLRVYEKLRRHLCAPVGLDAFQALASRALTLARSKTPALSAVDITPHGSLSGIIEPEAAEPEAWADSDQDREVGVILIAHLLGLVVTFLGEATTLGLIEELRLQAESGTGPPPLTETPEAFADLMRETDGLRNVSQRLETMADQNPGLEDGLITIAGSIRSIASVLDVFAVIRSQSAAPPEDTHPVTRVPYLM